MATLGQASSFAGSRLRRAVENGTISKCSALKKDIHPKFYPQSKVFCNGVEVISLGGTKAEYVVDVWSGNHPFYQGAKSTIVVDDGRVSKFNKMYPDLSATMGNVQTLAGAAEDATAEKKAGPKIARLPKGAKKK